MLCLSMEEGERLKEAALYAGVFHGRAEQGILLCYSSASLSWRVTDVPRLSASQSASEGKGMAPSRLAETKQDRRADVAIQQLGMQSSQPDSQEPGRATRKPWQRWI